MDALLNEAVKKSITLTRRDAGLASCNFMDSYGDKLRLFLEGNGQTLEPPSLFAGVTTKKMHFDNFSVHEIVHAIVSDQIIKTEESSDVKDIHFSFYGLKEKEKYIVILAMLWRSKSQLDAIDFLQHRGSRQDWDVTQVSWRSLERVIREEVEGFRTKMELPFKWILFENLKKSEDERVEIESFSFLKESPLEALSTILKWSPFSTNYEQTFVPGYSARHSEFKAGETIYHLVDIGIRPLEGENVVVKKAKSVSDLSQRFSVCRQKLVNAFSACGIHPLEFPSLDDVKLHQDTVKDLNERNHGLRKTCYELENAISTKESRNERQRRYGKDTANSSSVRSCMQMMLLFQRMPTVLSSFFESSKSEEVDELAELTSSLFDEISCPGGYLALFIRDIVGRIKKADILHALERISGAASVLRKAIARITRRLFCTSDYVNFLLKSLCCEQLEHVVLSPNSTALGIVLNRFLDSLLQSIVSRRIPWTVVFYLQRVFERFSDDETSMQRVFVRSLLQDILIPEMKFHSLYSVPTEMKSKVEFVLDIVEILLSSEAREDSVALRSLRTTLNSEIVRCVKEIASQPQVVLETPDPFPKVFVDCLCIKSSHLALLQRISLRERTRVLKALRSSAVSSIQRLLDSFSSLDLLQDEDYIVVHMVHPDDDASILYLDEEKQRKIEKVLPQLFAMQSIVLVQKPSPQIVDAMEKFLVEFRAVLPVLVEVERLEHLLYDASRVLRKQSVALEERVTFLESHLQSIVISKMAAELHSPSSSFVSLMKSFELNQDKSVK